MFQIVFLCICFQVLVRHPAVSFAEAVEVYNYVLLSLSGIFIIANIVYIITLYRTARLTELLMLCFLISLLCALLFYAIGVVSSIGGQIHVIACEAIAAMLQFFFLSTMTWISIFAYSITHAVFANKLISSDCKKFKFYVVYGLGAPSALTLVAVMLSQISQFGIQVYQHGPDCFLENQYVRLATFLIPIYMMITSNVIMTILCVQKIVRSGSIQSSERDRKIKKTITILKLTICLGSGYILLFFAYMGTDQTLWTVFKIFVEIQGVLVVCANIINLKCLKSIPTHNKRIIMQWRPIKPASAGRVTTGVIYLSRVNTSETSLGSG